MKEQRQVVDLMGDVLGDMQDIIKYKKEPKKILFATWLIKDKNLSSMERNSYMQYMRRYLQELNSVGNVEITIKLHPREKDDGIYKSVVKSLGYSNVKILKTENETQTTDFLYSLIKDSDLVISFGSTIAVESLVIGTPTIIINLFGLPNDPILREGVIHLNPDEDISEIVSEILYDKDRIADVLEKGNQKVNEYMPLLDGRASERVMEVIKKLI